MLATYGAALLIIVASLYVGRAFFALFGRRETLWLETPVGLAILIVVTSVITRIGIGTENAGIVPERAELSLIVCAVLLAASILYLRLSFADRESALIGLPVALFALLLASLPFIASGHIGIPGIGINNDMAAHLIWSDWLQTPVGPEPNGIQQGYPVGPHGLAATVAEALGTEPLYAFLGLLIAIPAITALTSLNVLAGLPPVTRTLAAGLVSLPYLAASTLGIAGFKELLAGLFLLAFALILREIERIPERRTPWVVALGFLAAALVASYSYPGLIWPAALLVVWGGVLLVRAWRRDRLEELRAQLRRNSRLLWLGAAAVLGLVLLELPRIIEFIDSGIVGFVQETDSKLRFPVSPFEALGVWPTGEFLLGDSALDAWPVFGAIGLIAFAFALAWWIWRRDLALPAAVIGGAVVYLGTVLTSGRYVEAKALVVPASAVMLLILAALLLPERSAPSSGGASPERGGPEGRTPQRRGPRWLHGPARLGIAVPFILLAAYSSFLALRDAVIAPQDRFNELRMLRDEVAGSSVLALTSDRYTDYYLRGALVRSPAKNAEQTIPGRPGKEFRLPVDFDSAMRRELNDFDYAITTDAEYQSGAPPTWEEVARTESYVLWRKTEKTAHLGILAEASRPGRVFRCENPKLARLLERDGIAIVWPRPVIAKRLYWEPSRRLEPGDSASQTITLPPGSWDLSFQYSSPVASVQVQAGDLDVEMPPGVEGGVPFRPDQGPFWPVGAVESTGEPLEITVTANELSGLQRALGVDAEAAIGNIAATRLAEITTPDFEDACGQYVDHYYITDKQGRIKFGKGEFEAIQPER